MVSKTLDSTTRERVVEAAGEIFAERGFEGTTVRDVCQRAGANLAAVNYYFGDKQRLYVEAVIRAHQWRMARATLPLWTADTPPREKLADFIAAFLQRVLVGAEGTWQTRLIMREIAQPTEACAELVQASIRPQFEILIGILRELLPANAPEENLHLIAFSVVGQCLFYHFADPVVRNLLSSEEYGGLDVAKLGAHIAQFSTNGIDGIAGSGSEEAR
jgi:TetR/AcrR family transcriptional regulator, regulator of cefoperazone and chloramphenicol sensitivity